MYAELYEKWQRKTVPNNFWGNVLLSLEWKLVGLYSPENYVKESCADLNAVCLPGSVFCW